ncbi:MAG TPA: adenylate/guanylate cyclase domain-containing protein [Flavobacteriales bacterium]
MARLVLLLLLLAPCRVLAGADSLWTAWNNGQLPDSSRLKAIQTLAWKTVFEQPDSGIALAQRQLTFAQRVHDRRAEYEAHTTMAVGASIQSRYDEALGHLQRCLAIALELQDRKRESNTYSNRSNIYRSLGDLPLALGELQKSIRIDRELGNKEGLAGSYNNIGNLHTELGQLDKALENYRLGSRISEEIDSDKGRAQAFVNLGNTHMQLGALDTALHEFQEGAKLYKQLGRKLELGIAFNNMGRTLGLLGDTRQAFAYLDSATTLLSAVGSMRQLARTHVNRGNLLLDRHRYAEAVRECEAGNRIAEENGLLLQRKECLQCLDHAYESLGDHRRAHAAQKAFIAVNDSLIHLNNGKEVTRLEVTRAFQERMLADSLTNVRQRYEERLAYQGQIAREREQRNILLFVGIGVLVLSVGLWNRLRSIRRSRAAIQREKDRSDDLLHNILPVEVAAELKDKGSAEARHFEEVTILFTDFKGFTGIAEKLSPSALVTEIDTCFKAFDTIMAQHRVEKIKTIGDAYMAAGGVPQPRKGSAVDVVLAALDMQDFMQQRRHEREAIGAPAFSMRVGIHTGPVVAGIVGLRKFQYDIWGDAVNIASRMESSGEPGRVNISAATHHLVKDAGKVNGEWKSANGANLEAGISHSPFTNSHSLAFVFTPRGLVQAKGKGEVEMFFVDRGDVPQRSKDASISTG